MTEAARHERDAALQELDGRIERLALDPASVRAIFARLARPILLAIGYRPRIRTEAAAALLGALADPAADAAVLADKLEAALEELADNVTAAERACVVHGSLPFAEAAWLHRLHDLVARAARVVSAPEDRAARRAAAAVEPAVLTPLRLLDTPTPQSPSPGVAPPEGRAGGEAPSTAPAGPAELELVAIDRIMEAARAEASFLGRRRRLLEAARALLLDAAAALPLEPGGVDLRQRGIAAEIARIDRLEAAGLGADVGLLHQARGALARGDTQRLHAALVALDGAAIASGDAATAARTTAALQLLTGDDGGMNHAESLQRSADEVLGAAAADAVRHGYGAARQHIQSQPPAEDAPRVDRETYQLALEYLAPGAEQAAFAALLAVDGCFDVGATLSPVRITEIEHRARVVPYPTDPMILMPARGPADLPAALIEDPRDLLASLATGRLLARKYVEHQPVRRQRTRLTGEVRIFVLDGSTSMLEHGGARARVRDAILLAELGTLLRRFETAPTGRGRGHAADRVRVVLFYRYFTKRLGPLMRVDSGPSALAAIGDVLSAPRSGGTDIEAALVSSFELIRDEGQRDPDLARAQIVLVTDGEAAVDEEAVRAAREGAGAVPTQVSVIALGEENPALRGIVARQRARGERAFYHHLRDDALRDICEGGLDRGPPIHLPEDRSQELGALQTELGALLDELALAERDAARAAPAPHRAPPHRAPPDLTAGPEEHLAALRELGVLDARSAFALEEAARARREAQDRDDRALSARFSRWFPAPLPRSPAPDAPRPGAPAPLPAPGERAREDIDAVDIILGTVAEVVREVGGAQLARRADAIELLERLLPDARLSPARYLAVLREHPAPLAPALAAVHAAVTPPAAM